MKSYCIGALLVSATQAQTSVTKVPGTTKCKAETSNDEDYRMCMEDAKSECDMKSQANTDYLNEKTGCKITREDWLWKSKEYECAGTPTKQPATYCSNMKCYTKFYGLQPLLENLFFGNECSSPDTSATRVGSRPDTSATRVGSRPDTSVTLVGSLAVVVIAIFAVTF